MAEIKRGKGRKALKTLTGNDVNISAGKASSSPLPPFAKAEQENRDSLVSILSPQKGNKIVSKSKARATTKKDFADELQELQGRLEQLQLEKEKTEILLKQRDETLKLKEEDLENRAKEQERLQKELKKLQKLKEFKPTVSIPFIMSLREKEQEKKDNKKNKKKKDKDSMEKKRPCPAYILWCKDQWREVKKENPYADFKEISNALGAKWKTLSAEEKKPYKDKYQQEKEAYLQIVGLEKRENEAMKLLEEEQLQKTAMELLEQYLQFKQQEVDKEGKKMRKEKDPLKPKQPMSAFFLFSQERRASLLEQNKNVLEIAKIAGEEWKNMTEEQRARYEEIAKKCKDEYNQQMELYKQNKLKEAATLEKEEEDLKKVLKQEALQLLKKKEKTENIIKKTKKAQQKKKKKEEQNADPNKPRRPPSSFLLFSMEARKQLLEERPGIGNSTLRALISVKWKELSETEKLVWNDKAAEGMATYKREMEYNKLIAMGKIDTPNDES